MIITTIDLQAQLSEIQEGGQYVHYLIISILTLATTCLTVKADNTIVIKKYKSKGNSLLDRKIIYMDMGEKPSTQASSKGLANLAAPSQKPVKAIAKPVAKKSFQVKKLKNKTKLSSIGKDLRKNFGRGAKGQASQPDIGEYSDEDWGDYAEYREVELETSLGVSAKIKR